MRSIGQARSKGFFSLLFIGKEWSRKGGDIAIDVTMELNRRGVRTKLHVVGGVPPVKVDSDFVEVHGLLDKADVPQAIRLEGLFRQADAFILPSSSEGFVISVLEACAYGLPTLAYDTLGINGAVLNGDTGELLRLGQPAAAYADIIERWLQSPEEYARMAKNARRHFEVTANWPSCVKQLIKIIKQRMVLNEDSLCRFSS